MDQVVDERQRHCVHDQLRATISVEEEEKDEVKNGDKPLGELEVLLVRHEEEDQVGDALIVEQYVRHFAILEADKVDH